MDDTTLIAHLGGPAKLASRLGYDKKPGGVQRVHNWRTRGIPASVKVEFPEIFLTEEARGPAPQIAPSDQPHAAGQGV